MPLPYARRLGAMVFIAGAAAIAAPAVATATAPPWTVTTTITGVPRIYGAEFTPDGSKLYVAKNGNNGGFEVVDPVTNTATATTTLSPAGNPSSLAMNPDGRHAYISDWAGGFIWVIDTATDTVSSTMSTGVANISDLAVTPDGAGIYFSTWASGHVYYADLSTGHIDDIPTALTRGEGIDINPSGTTVYVAGEPTRGTSTGVVKIDTATKTPSTMVTTNASWPTAQSLKVDPLGRYVYVYDEYENSLITLDASTLATVNTMSLGVAAQSWWGQPNELAVASNGRYALVGAPAANGWNGEGYVVDLASHSVMTTLSPGAGTPGIPAGESPLVPAINPAGSVGYMGAFGSAPGGTLTVLTMLTVPGPPTGVSVTPGKGTLTVGFTAPADDGGSPITDYEYSLDGGATWVSGATATGPITIPALTGGRQYPVKVRAVNAVGAGRPSASVNGTPDSTATESAGQPVAPVASAPTIAVRGASVLKGTTLRTIVTVSDPGTVRVGATLHGRTVCTATIRVSSPGRAALTCHLTHLAQAAVLLHGTTFRVTGTLTTASGATASAARTVHAARYRVRPAVTG